MCENSRYIDNYRRYMKYFKRQQMHVVDGDALIKYPLPELKKVEHFLGLNPKFNEKDFVLDERRGFFCMQTNGQSKCLKGSKGRPHPKVNPKDLEKLKEYFRPFNREFENALGQNFDW